MEAKSLRLGNYVMNGDDIGRVERLSIIRISTSSPHVGVEISPIKLTEEWLITFGFGKKEFRSMFDNRDEYWLDRTIVTEVSERNTGFYLHAHNGVEMSFRDDSMVYRYVKLDYVHQLQNIYFALTGKELELKSFVEEK